MSPFNSDNSKFSWFTKAISGSMTAPASISGNFRSRSTLRSEPRWSRKDNHTIYYVHGNQFKTYDISGGAIAIVHTFSEYSAISGLGESDISYDGDHFVFAGDGHSIFVYQISTGTKSADIRCRPDTVG